MDSAMSPQVFSEDSLDDLLHRLFRSLIETGERIVPGKGACREHFGALVELRNPRARLSRSEGKGKIFSALGETCWYLSGSDLTASIKYYLDAYPAKAGEEIHIQSAYGPRLFGTDDGAQIDNIVKVLRRGRDSRRAVAQIFSASDLAQAANWNKPVDEEPEVPCTCVLQFAIRKDRVVLSTYMRSNDAYRGLPHDIFAFTMIQELVARRLDLDIGTYRHAVGSLHLYEADIGKANAYLAEGWQRAAPMAPMPKDKHDESVEAFLTYERQLRTGSHDEPPTDLAPYWKDLSWLLYAFSRAKVLPSPLAIDAIDSVRRKLSNQIFSVHLLDKISQLKERQGATSK